MATSGSGRQRLSTPFLALWSTFPTASRCASARAVHHAVTLRHTLNRALCHNRPRMRAVNHSTLLTALKCLLCGNRPRRGLASTRLRVAAALPRPTLSCVESIAPSTTQPIGRSSLSASALVHSDERGRAVHGPANRCGPGREGVPWLGSRLSRVVPRTIALLFGWDVHANAGA